MKSTQHKRRPQQLILLHLLRKVTWQTGLLIFGTGCVHSDRSSGHPVLNSLFPDLNAQGVPEGKAGTSPGEIPWLEMIQDYAAAAPAIGAWTQQSLSANATTVCVKLPKVENNRSIVPVSFAPQQLWYPGQGPGASLQSYISSSFPPPTTVQMS